MNIAIITGASSGLGKEFLKQTDSYNFDEIWVIARQKEKLEALKDIVHTNLKIIPLDLSLNSSFKIYEEELKKELRKYVRKPEVERGRLSESVHTPEAILSFVQRMHQIYMRMQSGVKRDCEYIIELCHTVVDALLILFEELTKQLHLSLVSL